MQLTFHLFHDAVTDFSSAIRKEKLKGKDGFKPVILKATVAFDAEAYLQRRARSPHIVATGDGVDHAEC